MTHDEVTAAMEAEDVDAGLVEKALAAAFRMPDGYAEAHPGVMSDLKVAYGDQYRAALAAVMPEVRAQAWDEGYSHCFDQGPDDDVRSLSDNPYRTARLTATTQVRCNCGFGGFHDDANPRCDKNGATEEPTTAIQRAAREKGWKP